MYCFLTLLIVDSPCAEPIDIRPHSRRMLVHTPASQLERLSFSTLFFLIIIKYYLFIIILYFRIFFSYVRFVYGLISNSVFLCVCVYLCGIFVSLYILLLLLLLFRSHFACMFYYPTEKSKELFIITIYLSIYIYTQVKFVCCTFHSILFLYTTIYDTSIVYNTS